MIVEATKLDIMQYTVQYELLRFQVIGSPGMSFLQVNHVALVSPCS